MSHANVVQVFNVARGRRLLLRHHGVRRRRDLKGIMEFMRSRGTMIPV